MTRRKLATLSRKYKLIRRPFFKGGRRRGWASIRLPFIVSTRTINPTPSGSLSGPTLPRENRTHASFFPRILILCALVTAIHDLSICCLIYFFLFFFFTPCKSNRYRYISVPIPRRRNGGGTRKKKKIKERGQGGGRGRINFTQGFVNDG